MRYCDGCDFDGSLDLSDFIILRKCEIGDKGEEVCLCDNCADMVQNDIQDSEEYYSENFYA